MSITLDYQKPSSPWFVRKNLGWLLIGSMLCLFVAGALILSLVARHQTVVPGTARHYWEVLLSLQGYQVDEDSTSAYYVWVLRDNWIYFKVAKRDVAAQKNEQVVAQIRQLISFALSEVSQHGYAWGGEGYHADLVALSGQDFGNDWKRWKDWADNVLKSADISPNAYESLRLARRRSESENHSLVVQDKAEHYWRIQYQHEVQQFWIRSLPSIIGIALCIFGVIRCAIQIKRPAPQL